MEPELELIKKAEEEAKKNKVSLKDLKTPYIMRPLLIGVTLMSLQQLSGVNAIVFNVHSVFNVSEMLCF